MFSEGYVKASNKLLRAVQADIQNIPLLAGVRALGILHKHFTEPFWRMIENPKIHVIDLKVHIQTAYNTLEKWKEDSSPLLQTNLSHVFCVNGVPILPQKDCVYEALKWSL